MPPLPAPSCPICLSPLGSTPVDRMDSCALLQCPRCDLQVWYPAHAADAHWYDTSTHYLASPLVDRLGWYHRWALAHLPADARTLLDIGCGDGRFVYAAARRGVEAHGIDHSARLVALGNERHRGTRLTRRSIQELSFVAERYDAVTLFEVIEHVEQPLELLRLARSLVRERGYVVVSTPNRLGRPWRHALDHPPHHLSRWTPRTLRQAVEGAGLEPVEVALSPAIEGLYEVLLDVRLGIVLRLLQRRARRSDAADDDRHGDIRTLIRVKDVAARASAAILAPLFGRWFRGAQMVALARQGDGSGVAP